jgi:hypothetical protein
MEKALKPEPRAVAMSRPPRIIKLSPFRLTPTRKDLNNF